MNPEEASLRTAIDVLERVGIPYMLTGSMATSYHGRPRATHDADIVIDPTTEQLETLVQDLEGAGFYVDLESARDALRRRSQFKVIETRYAWKIDLIIRKDRAFSHEEFGRQTRLQLAPGLDAAMVTPEDAILSKLECRRSGDSERQLRDAAGVVELNPSLDRSYVERWATALGGADLWRRISGVR